jgi:hypothetical protein
MIKDKTRAQRQYDDCFKVLEENKAAMARLIADGLITNNPTVVELCKIQNKLNVSIDYMAQSAAQAEARLAKFAKKHNLNID